MAFRHELKLKAKIADIESMRTMVLKLAKFHRKVKYVDAFFESAKLGKISRLRVRKSDRNVSLKINIAINHVQFNAIYDFGLQDPDDYVKLLEVLDFKPCLVLRKNSELFGHDDIHIELTSAEGIGNYIELIVFTREKEISKNTGKLEKLAQKLGLSKKSMDSRYYSDIKKYCELS